MEVSTGTDNSVEVGKPPSIIVADGVIDCLGDVSIIIFNLVVGPVSG